MIGQVFSLWRRVKIQIERTPVNVNVMFCLQLLDHTLADITPWSDVIRKDRQLEIHMFNDGRLMLVRYGAQGQDHAILRGVMQE